jgi:hypothetical protein
MIVSNLTWTERLPEKVSWVVLLPVAHLARLTPMVEWLFCKQIVGGSNPSTGVKLSGR